MLLSVENFTLRVGIYQMRKWGVLNLQIKKDNYLFDVEPKITLYPRISISPNLHHNLTLIILLHAKQAQNLNLGTPNSSKCKDPLDLKTVYQTISAFADRQ